MEQNKTSTATRKGKYLNRRERISIEDFLKTRASTQWIADQLGRNISTIKREITRGQITRTNSDLSTASVYSADRGQDVHEKNVSAKGPSVKLMANSEELRFICDCILIKRWSPEVASALMKQMEMENAVCFKSIYSYIIRGEIPGVTTKSLWEKGRRSKKAKTSVPRQKKGTPTGRSIEDRPENVEDREDLGHWEIDLVVSGKNKGKAALLTLTERKTRKEIIRKIDDATQSSVIEAINGIERSMGKEIFLVTFNSMTADNGSEFLDYLALERSVFGGFRRTHVYFAHPYCSWERGSNENANRIIRRFIPKGSDISTFTDEDIQRIEDWMNHYPRKILNFKTPEEMFIQEMAA